MPKSSPIHKLDWANDAHYLFTQKLTNRQWAWQYLRRNESYKSDWADLEGTGRHKEYFARKLMGVRWDLEQLVDPREENPSLGWLVSESPPRLHKGSNSSRHLRSYLDPNCYEKVAYGFDLTRSITTQLQLLKEALLARQKVFLEEGKISKRKKIQSPRVRENMRTHLRLLDALEADVPRKTILNTLIEFNAVGIVDPEDKYKRLLKQAQHLRESGYIGLLLP